MKKLEQLLEPDVIESLLARTAERIERYWSFWSQPVKWGVISRWIYQKLPKDYSADSFIFYGGDKNRWGYFMTPQGQRCLVPIGVWEKMSNDDKFVMAVEFGNTAQYRKRIQSRIDSKAYRDKQKANR